MSELIFAKTRKTLIHESLEMNAIAKIEPRTDDDIELIRLANEDLEKNWSLIVSMRNEKWIAQNIFGSWGSYNEFKQFIKSKAKAKEDYLNGIDGMMISKEDGEASTANDHQPVLSSNRKRLGTELNKSIVNKVITGTLQEFPNVESFIEFMLSENYKTVPKDKIEKIMKDVNKVLRKQASSSIGFVVKSESSTDIALDKIRKELVDAHATFGESEKIATEIKQITEPANRLIADIAVHVAQKKNPKRLAKLMTSLITHLDSFSDAVLVPIHETATFTSNSFASKDNKNKQTNSIKNSGNRNHEV